MARSTKTPGTQPDIAKEINDSLLANINHALRTPLNGLVGMSDLLAKSGLSDEQLRYAHIIRQSMENLMLQMDNILELAKIEDGKLIIKPSLTRLDDLVKTALHPHIPYAVKNDTPLSLEISPDLPEYIVSDAQKLRLVLTNLISCALKFAKRGKIILKISGHQHPENTDIFQFRFQIDNSKILYDMLHKAMEEYKDTGNQDLRDFGEITLSLLTSQRLLDAMGSGIKFDNLRGNEPPFHFDIEIKRSAEKMPASGFSAIQGKRALILQKDMFELNMLTQTLRLWNIDYRTIDDEKKLLHEIDDAYCEGRKYHILFCDDLLHRTDFENIKKKIPYIVLNSPRQSTAENSLTQFSAVLHSPVFPEELLRTLTNFFHPHREESETTISQEASQHSRKGSYPHVDAKVLVVEDDFVSRMYATELLESFGCTVITAENGALALGKITAKSDYDVIFMDCMMPEMDGYKATRKIRENGYSMPIIALTANTMEQDREKCLSAGMTDYIPKPVKEQDLYTALTRHTKK